MDCLIVGGGVIGLSLAWELSKRGRQVHVIDRQEPAREASWAGAGMLPPAARQNVVHPFDHLRALSHELHPIWAAELREETGIDTGFRRTGAIYLARRPGEAASLVASAAFWRDEGITVEPLSTDALAEMEPALAPLAREGAVRAAYLLPEESQLRNPWHMRALLAACQKRGVKVTAHCAAQSFLVAGGRVEGVQTDHGVLQAEQYCICSGAWTRMLLEQLGVTNGIEPIRGQIVLFRSPTVSLRRIIIEGSRYLVPRDDGRVLAGSTEEEEGFDKSTTETAIADITRFATTLAPTLANAVIEKTWAGLRPGTYDGLPYLGRAPGWENVYVAAGHFRNGIQLSPGTAVEMARLLCGEPNTVDLSPFHVGRRRDFD